MTRGIASWINIRVSFRLSQTRHDLKHEKDRGRESDGQKNKNREADQNVPLCITFLYRACSNTLFRRFRGPGRRRFYYSILLRLRGNSPFCFDRRDRLDTFFDRSWEIG